MGKYKSLVVNTVIFGICNFTSKLLVFLMLPFYTSVLSKEEFGTSDLISTIVGLIIPILTLSVSNGCMRYALDKSKNLKSVFTFGMRVVLLSILIIVVSYPLLIHIPIINNYIWLFVFLYIAQVFHAFTGLFARGMSKVKIVGIAGVVSSFVVVLSNILFLFIFRLGVNGYLLSMIISNLVFSIILFFGCQMNKLFASENDKSLSKEILAYSIPIIPNSLSWWIQHSANRYILSFYCGVAEVGLYSAASKVPMIIDTFRGIFVQAWQLSTITEFDNDGSKEFFQTIHRIYNAFLLLMCLFLLLSSKLLAQFLYSASFYDAWIFSPLLVAGVLFSSLVAFFSPTYLAYKKTNKLFISTLFGAITTIILNFILIPLIGPIGAALSTLLSNIVIYLYLYFDSQKYLGIRLGRLSHFVSYLLIILLSCLISFSVIEPIGLISSFIVLLILAVNYADMKLLVLDVKRVLLKKRKKYEL